jgi:hypothetical protein
MLPGALVRGLSWSLLESPASKRNALFLALGAQRVEPNVLHNTRLNDFFRNLDVSVAI